MSCASDKEKERNKTFESLVERNIENHGRDGQGSGRKERGNGERGNGERGRSEEGRGERTKDERGRGERGRGEIGRGERGKGERGRVEGGKGERGRGGRGRGERGRGERGRGDRGLGERGRGDRGLGERGFGERYRGYRGGGQNRSEQGRGEKEKSERNSDTREKDSANSYSEKSRPIRAGAMRGRSRGQRGGQVNSQSFIKPLFSPSEEFGDQYQKHTTSKTYVDPLEIFKDEVIRLISQSDEKTIPLSQFVQIYESFYNKQLKNHGFEKLIDLLNTVAGADNSLEITAEKKGATRCLKLLNSQKKVLPGAKIRPNNDANKQLFSFKSHSPNIIDTEGTDEEEKCEHDEGKDTHILNYSEDVGFDGETREFEPKTNAIEQNVTNTPMEANAIAIFWDIENCPVPKGMQTSKFVQQVRESFCKDRQELEFVALNNGQNRKLNLELHELGIDASLSVIDKKNSADDILKEKMNSFVEKRGKENPCNLLLISGDVDFSRDLSRFRYKYKYNTILIHNRQAKGTLLSVVNECHDIQALTQQVVSTSEKEHDTDSTSRKHPLLTSVNRCHSSARPSVKPDIVPNIPAHSICLVAEISTLDVDLSKASEFISQTNQQIAKSLSMVCDYDVTSLKKETDTAKKVFFSATIKVMCGKKKLQKVKECWKLKSDSEIHIECYSEVNITNDFIQNEMLKKESVKTLETKIFKLLESHQKKLEDIEGKLKLSEESKNALTSIDKKASETFNNMSEVKKLDAMINNLNQDLNDLNEEKYEFNNSIIPIMTKIKEMDTKMAKNYFANQISEVRFKLGIEFLSFENPLPIYKYRKKVKDTVLANSVTILMAETGSGKSTQVVQYLAEVLPPGKIVCTQPRKIAAVSLATHVAKQMGSSLGDLVGYKVGSQSKVSKNTRIIFMTDQMLLKECATDPHFLQYSCIVLDEVHERSINTDLLLGLTKTGLAVNKNLKIVITSATMDSAMFLDHYSDKETSIAKLDVPGRTYPIEVLWGKGAVDTGRSYLDAVLTKTQDVLKNSSQGDILVFVATPADTDSLSGRLKSQSSSNIEVLQLHGKLQIEEQKKIFEHGHKRKVIFATNCAETSVTVPGIKYVIDSGVAKEKKFDPLRNTSSLVIQKINRSSAKQRAGRAGRTQPGVCHRLYSCKEFENMDTSMVPDIKKVGLGQTVLKLLNLGISQPETFPFIESPGRENLLQTVKTLVALDAIEEGKDGMILTKIGCHMAKLPLEPRLAKLVLLANEAGVGEEGINMASLCSIAGSVFFRMGSEDVVVQADQKKITFCDEDGDFVTLLEVYNTWFQVAEKSKSKWCMNNFINGKSMKIARDTAKDIRMAITDCKLKINASKHKKEDIRNILLKIVFNCFKENLCLYSGHPKLGYINIQTSESFPIHPSCSFLYLGQISPQLIIYDQVLTTSKSFLLNLSYVKEEWLSEKEKEKVQDAEESVVTSQCTGPFGSRILKQYMLGPKARELQKLEKEVRESHPDMTFLKIDCNVEKGWITWTTNHRFHEQISLLLTERINKFKEVLVTECMLTSAQKDSGGSKALIGAGGILKDVVLSNEFVDIMIKKDKVEGLLNKANNLPGAYKSFDTKQQGLVVCYNSVIQASDALIELQNEGGKDSCYPLKTSEQKKTEAGFEMKVTFRRRKLRDFGFIKFDCEEDCYAATMKLNGCIYLPNGNRIMPRPNKTDRKSLFLPLKGMSVLQLEDPKKEIENEIKAHNITFSEVFIPMEPARDSTKEESEELKHRFQNLLYDFDRNDYTINIRQRRPKDFFWVILLRFSSFSIGLSALESIQRKRNIEWSDGPVGLLRREVFKVEYNMTTSFSCNKKVFDAIQETVKRTIQEVSEICKTDKLDLNVNEYNSGENHRAVFVLHSNDMRTIAMAIDALQDIMKGEKLDHPNISLVLSAGYISSLRRVEETTGGYLERNQRGRAITVYGSEAQTNQSKTMINALLKKIIEDGYNTFHESLQNYPKGIVGAMLKRFGADLGILHELEGVHSVKFLVSQRKLEVVASPSSLEEVLDAIRGLAGELSEAADSEEESCPVCLVPPEAGERTRLQHCGHLYCSPCLRMQITASAWPLACCEQGCDLPLVVEDFKALEREDKVTKMIIRGAVEDHLKRPDCSLAACPSPDCEGVFRCLKPGQEGDNSEPFFCVSCGVDICRSCRAVYHYGMSCSFFQIYKSDDNHSLRVWLSEGEDRKLCPGCQAPIEKNGGCLHVHCIRCSAHMCWFCMKVFPTGGHVYQHMCSARR